MALAGDHRLGGGDHRAVVDGVVEDVAGAGGREVGGQVEVDLEGLSPVLFFGEGSVDADDPQAAQLDALAQDASGPSVRASATSSRPGGPIWRELICSTMEMAWASEGTSPA